MQPASAEETLFIKAHKPFLLRNLTKVVRNVNVVTKAVYFLWLKCELKLTS